MHTNEMHKIIVAMYFLELFVYIFFHTKYNLCNDVQSSIVYQSINLWSLWLNFFDEQLIDYQMIAFNVSCKCCHLDVFILFYGAAILISVDSAGDFVFHCLHCPKDCVTYIFGCLFCLTGHSCNFLLL